MHDRQLHLHTDDLADSDGAGAVENAGADRSGPANHRAAHLAKGGRRPVGTLWRANPREQGLLGLTDAIGWFGRQGWSVSLPLIDSQPYDLIADDGDRLHRVQVKTTTQRTGSGHFRVQLCTRGGNQSFHTTKHFDRSSCDLVFVLTDDGTRFVIPAKDIEVTSVLVLNHRFVAVERG